MPRQPLLNRLAWLRAGRMGGRGGQVDDVVPLGHLAVRPRGDTRGDDSGPHVQEQEVCQVRSPAAADELRERSPHQRVELAIGAVSQWPRQLPPISGACHREEGVPGVQDGEAT